MLISHLLHNVCVIHLRFSLYINKNHYSMDFMSAVNFSRAVLILIFMLCLFLLSADIKFHGELNPMLILNLISVSFTTDALQY